MCTSNAIASYNFKLASQKSANTLSQLLTPSNISDIDSIDINVIHLDHEYELPMLSYPPNLNLDSNIMQDLTITPVQAEEVTEDNIEVQEKISSLIVEKEKPFLCTLCPSTFTNVYGLKYHMEKHTAGRHKLCQLCGKSFITSGGLRQHLTTHKNARFKCKECGKLYKSKQMTEEHIRKAHSSNRYAYSCHICDKHFTVKASLTSHMLTHKERQNIFLCQHCPKKYSTMKSLKVHSQVHFPRECLKELYCPYTGCNKFYLNKQGLFTHISYCHTKERPYICSVCSKTFVTISSLNKHRKMHDNSECDVCKQTFLNKRLLKQHLRDHEQF